MVKFARIALLTATVLCLPILARAQNGCIDSPENPTAILGLVGIAACALPVLRDKIRSRRR